MGKKDEITDSTRSLIFINILICCIASSMLATALTTALPPIITDLNVDAVVGQWLTSAYSLAMGIVMPLSAFLITRFPTRRLYISSISLFIVGTIVCATALDFTQMILGRVMQACAGGMLTSMAQVILLSVYPPEKRGSVMGWYGLSIGAAPVIAPTIAGILVDFFDWRAIFCASGSIMCISLIVALFCFADVLDISYKKFDVISFVFSAISFGGITLGVGNITNMGVASPLTFLPLLLGIGAMIFFAYRQLHVEEPFLDLGILKYRDYVQSVIGSMLLYFSMMGSSILIPLYVQSVMKESATVSGLVTLPGSLAMALVSPFAGKIYDKIGIKKLFIAGNIAMGLSNVGMFFCTLSTSIWVSSALNVIRCMAIGCMLMPLVTWGASAIPDSLTAHGTALLTSLRTVAGAIGTVVFVGIFSYVSRVLSDEYGNEAGIWGINVAFLAMASVSMIMLCMCMRINGKLPAKADKEVF